MTNEIDRDNEQFNKGVLHTVELLAKALNATGWYAGDGSEDYDDDLTQTLFNILIAAGLWDADENAPAKDADAVALKSISEDVYWLLAKGRLRPTEPLYAIQLLRPGTEEVIAEAEGDSIQQCVAKAIEGKT